MQFAVFFRQHLFVERYVQLDNQVAKLTEHAAVDGLGRAGDIGGGMLLAFSSYYSGQIELICHVAKEAMQPRRCLI